MSDEIAGSKKVKPVISDLLRATGEHSGITRLYDEFDGRKQPITYEDLAKVIDRQSSSTIFVLDSSFIPRHDIDLSVWEALFRKRVVVPPFVWEELQEWLNNPYSNKDAAIAFRQAEGRRSESILLDHETPWPREFMSARQYYVTLLSSRKQRAKEVVDRFVEKFGRTPNNSELNQLLQRNGTDRDFHLLRKGFLDYGISNYFADEDALVTAAMIAFVGGCNTVVLTRDGDVLDQLNKLTDLLTVQYQAMLFADFYASASDKLATRPMPRDVPEVDAYFHADTSLLVRKPVEDLDKFVDSILPQEFEEVVLTCVLLGGLPPSMTRSFIRYVGEKDMSRLFSVKGATKGLSTDRLNGKNCHVTGFPIGIEDPRRWVVVSDDRYTELSPDPIRIAHLDRAHAIFHQKKRVIRD